MNIPDVLPLLKEYCSLEGNSVGGNLHIILDDGNIEDDHVKFCIAECLKPNSKGHDHLGLAICHILLTMSKTQRRKLSAMMYKEYAV